MSQDSLDFTEGTLNSEEFSIEELLETCAEEGISIDFQGSYTIKELGTSPDQDSKKKIDNEIIAAQSENGKETHPRELTQKPIPSARGNELAVNSEEAEVQDTFHEYSPGQKKVKGKNLWKRNVNYQKRMHGESYVGFDTGESARKRRTTTQTKERQARVMGPPCSSVLCDRRSTRHCGQFSPEARQELFNQFWVNMTWKEKRSFVKSSVDQRDPKHRKKGQRELRKTETVLYYLKLGGVKKQVCRNMFLSTLGLGRSQFRGWIKKTSTKTDVRPVIPKQSGGDSANARQFLLDIPKLPSHYCRESTSKLFLEPIIKSKFQLYKLYKEKCLEESGDPVSFWKFDKLFEEFNLSLHKPKKDWCDTCCSYDAGQLTKNEYEKHIVQKDAARPEKTKDKAASLQGNCHVLTMDVQGVLLSPVFNASALYYKTKLAVHNFTIFDLKTRKAKCFLWDETEAGLIASVFTTCLLTFLSENFLDNLPIIIFSDGCTNQNRNAVLSNALSDYAVKNNKIVIQKFLEKGHTQMEVDSVHACIEKASKDRVIYIPGDYIDICRRARTNPSEYQVQYMTYRDFKNYSQTETMRYASIRPGNKKNDPHVTDLRQLKYKPNGEIEYKIQHSDDWQTLPRNPKKLNENIYPALCQNKLPLTKRKYQDLKDLLHVIPEQYHDFYISLPHSD